MREEVKEMFRDNLTKINKRAHSFGKRLEPGWLKRKLLKLYFISPPKVQYFFRKYVMKSVLNKKKKDFQEIIRH